MPDFAVLRIAKIKSLSGLSGASDHNTRSATSGLDHADNHAPQMGGGCRLLMGSERAVEAWQVRAGSVGLRKPRKDAVRALEVVMSVSPEWFSQAIPGERQEWVEKSLSWAVKRFGSENILQATLHDDEETPHIHVLVIPVALKARKKAGRPRKGRESRPRPSAPYWGLSATDWIGSPEKLVEMQTDYAADVADLGIRRGRPRRTTGARHQSVHTYRAEAQEHLQETELAHIEAQNELGSARGKVMFAEFEAENILADAQQGAIASAKAFSVGLDAIDAGELVYEPASDRKKERLKKRPVKQPVLPIDQTSLANWRRAILPLFSTLISYARRIARVERERQDVGELARQAEKTAEMANHALVVNTAQEIQVKVKQRQRVR